MEEDPPITFDDIIGLQACKKMFNQAVVLPSLYPDLYTNTEPGMLLLGPPGNGKTMFGMAIKNMKEYNFFNITWMEGNEDKFDEAFLMAENTGKTSIIFIDMIDNVFPRLPAGHTHPGVWEFLLQCDRVTAFDKGRVFIIGASCSPAQLDELILATLDLRAFVGLPTKKARMTIIHRCSQQMISLSCEELTYIAEKTAGYSAHSLTVLCTHAAYVRLNEIPRDKISTISVNDVRPVSVQDIHVAMDTIRAIPTDHLSYAEWFPI